MEFDNVLMESPLDEASVECADRTPYVRCLQECVNFVLSNQEDIFDSDSIEWGRKFLLLSDLGQTLLSRLLSRSTVWMRTDKMAGCMPRHDPQPEESLEMALEDLISANFIIVLNGKHSSFSDAWQATMDCLVVDEIKVLHSNVLKIKARSGEKRERMLDAVYRAVTSSRDLFGQPISLARQMLLAVNPVRRPRTPRTSSSPAQFVRITPGALLALRRMQRLIQISSSSRSLTSGRDVISTYRPLQFDAAMLVVINRVRYPRYEVTASSPLFQSAFLFGQWEAACELRACLDELSLILSRKEENLAEYLLGTIGGEVTSGVGAEGGGSVLNLSAVQRSRLRSVLSRCERAAASFDVDDRYLSRHAAGGESIPSCRSSRDRLVPTGCPADVVDLTGDDEDDCSQAVATGAGQWEEDELGGEGSLFDCPALAMRRLLAVYMDEVESKTPVTRSSSVDRKGICDGQRRHCLLSLITVGAAICLVSYLKRQTVAGENRPSFLLDLDAGTLLSALCWDGVEHLEREGRALIVATKSSMETSAVDHLPLGGAIAVLRLLLYGRYFERLCIDYEHSGLLQESLRECSRAVQDSTAGVKGSFLIGLRKRHSRLSEKLNSKKKCNMDDVPAKFTVQVSLESVFLKMARAQDHMHPSMSSLRTERCHSLSVANAVDSCPSVDKLEKRNTRRQSEWSCSACTLLNAVNTWKCVLCGRDRVQLSVKVEAEAPLVTDSALTTCRATSSGAQTTDDDFVPARKNRKRSSAKSVATAGGGRASKRPSLSPTTSIHVDSDEGVACLISGHAEPVGGMGNEELLGVVRTVTMVGAALSSCCPAIEIGQSTRDGSRSHLSPSPDAGQAAEKPSAVLQLSDEEIDNMFGLKEMSHVYAPPTVVIVGRRLGDLRAGKNRLVGVTGDAVSVEKLVMQTMFNSYEEGVVFDQLCGGEVVPTADRQYFCGGWVGWHCEGSVLRTLFALLMWEELFLIPVDDVFQTRFQDSPLDLHADGGLFYLNRREAIDAKLCHLKAMASTELIDYKQFSSGAPDLFMIRAVTEGVESARSCEFDWTSLLGEGWGEVLEGEDSFAVDVWADDDMQMLSTVSGSRGYRRGRRLHGRQKEVSKPQGTLRTGSGGDIGNFFDRCRDVPVPQQLDSSKAERLVIDSADDGDAKEEKGIDRCEDEARPEQLIYDPFLSIETDIVLPRHPLHAMGCFWRYECMLVEVKGPTDRLSDMQQRWIHILNSNAIATLVCRVQEGRVMGSQGGHHRTAAFDDNTKTP